MKQIIATTDKKYVGMMFEDEIYLEGRLFPIDKITTIEPGIKRYSNSNYVIEAKEI